MQVKLALVVHWKPPLPAFLFPISFCLKTVVAQLWLQGLFISATCILCVLNIFSHKSCHTHPALVQTLCCSPGDEKTLYMEHLSVHWVCRGTGPATGKKNPSCFLWPVHTLKLCFSTKRLDGSFWHMFASFSFLQLSSFFSFMLDNFTQINGNGPGNEWSVVYTNIVYKAFFFKCKMCNFCIAKSSCLNNSIFPFCYWSDKQSAELTLWWFVRLYWFDIAK